MSNERALPSANAFNDEDEFAHWWDTVTTSSADPRAMASSGWLAALRHYRALSSEHNNNGDALAAALEPFANYAICTLEIEDNANPDSREVFTRLTYGHFRAAVAAMRGSLAEAISAPSHERLTDDQLEKAYWDSYAVVDSDTANDPHLAGLRAVVEACTIPPTEQGKP